MNEEDSSNSFKSWLLRKFRLEKSIELLNQVSDVKFESDISSIFLAAVAIDCSMNGCGSITGKGRQSRMKQSLRTWMIRNYSFQNVIVDDIGSTALKSLCIQQQGQTLILPNCSYLNDSKNPLQRQMNALYTKQFNRKWRDAKHRLHEKCLEDLIGSKAEPKYKHSFNHLSSENNSLLNQYEYFRHQLDAKTCLDVEASDPSSQHEILTSGYYKVTENRFKSFLSFGVQMMEDIVNKIIKDKTEKGRIESYAKELEQKEAYEQWLRKNSKRRSKCTEEDGTDHCKPKPSFFDNLGIQYDVMEEKKIFKLIQRPSTPRLWVEDDEEDVDENRIILRWESSDSEISHFLISSCAGQKIIWRDPEDDVRVFSLRRSIVLCKGRLYKFSAISVLLNGQRSDEVILNISTSPPSPLIPQLSRSTECSIDVYWTLQNNSNSTSILPEETDVEYGYKLDTKFILQLNRSGKWIDVSIGTNNCTASVVGLLPDNCYRIRIKSIIDGCPHVEGPASWFCTKIRLPAEPLLVKETSASSINLACKMPQIHLDDMTCSLISRIFCLYADSDECINHDQFRKMLIDLGSCSFDCVIEQLHDEGISKISLSDVLKMWKHHVSSHIYMRKIDRNGSRIPWNLVHKATTADAVEIRNLSSDSVYSFKIRYLTLRGKSVFSQAITSTTLPDIPDGINVIMIESANIYLNIRKPRGSKCKIQYQEACINGGKKAWKNVYTGRSENICIPCLRSNTKYKIRCCLLNNNSMEGVHIERIIATSGSMLSFMDDTIPDLFNISLNADDIVAGDFILFSEELYNELDDFYIDANENSVITRVKYVGEKHIGMEVIWDAISSMKTGLRIERSKQSLGKYEIMRMRWFDESAR